jgi:uncharacterized membrane protein YccC
MMARGLGTILGVLVLSVILLFSIPTPVAVILMGIAKGIQYAFSKSNINAINIAIIIIAAYLNVFLNTIESNVNGACK